MQSRQQGSLSESLARSWLESKGYRFLEANYSRRIGEIDLVVQHPDGNTIVFVEVRYRRSDQFGGAIASVDSRKQRKLIRTAKSWLQKNACSKTPARLDVIGLSPARGNLNNDAMAYAAGTHTEWKGHIVQWVINAVED